MSQDLGMREHVMCLRIKFLSVDHVNCRPYCFASRATWQNLIRCDPDILKWSIKSSEQKIKYTHFLMKYYASLHLSTSCYFTVPYQQLFKLKYYYFNIFLKKCKDQITVRNTRKVFQYLFIKKKVIFCHEIRIV